MTEKSQEKFDRIIYLQSKKFYAQLVKHEYPSPSLWWLMVFRMGRTSMQKMLDENWRDYTYYRDKGWFTSNFYYPATIDFVKKSYGNCIDHLTVLFSKRKPTQEHV